MLASKLKAWDQILHIDNTFSYIKIWKKHDYHDLTPNRSIVWMSKLRSNSNPLSELSVMAVVPLALKQTPSSENG